MSEKKNYYAVKVGLTPGIYKTWDECKSNVHGYPGAIYKGFKTLEEAEAFMNTGEKQENASVLGNENNIKSEAVAYVDGSFDAVTNRYSYGMLLTVGETKIEQCEAFSDEEMATMRNVAGEIEGSMHAMKYCLDHGIKSIDIFYDYEGIEKWALGIWKRNKEGTIEYKKFYDSIKDRLEVHFHKVKGHSGDKGNDRADELAKSALGL